MNSFFGIKTIEINSGFKTMIKIVRLVTVEARLALAIVVVDGL